LLLILLVSLGNAGTELRAASHIIAWGDNAFGQTNVPVGLTHVVAIAAGGAHSLALIGEPATEPRFGQRLVMVCGSPLPSWERW